MRIDCPKCTAVFAIDDRMIPPRGVRAQCPRCGEQVVVKPRPPEASSDSFLDDLSRPPGPPPLPSAPPPPPAPQPTLRGDDPLGDIFGGTGELVAPEAAPPGADAYAAMGFDTDRKPLPPAGDDPLADLGVPPAAPTDPFAGGDPFSELDFGENRMAGSSADEPDPFAAMSGAAPPPRRPPPPPEPAPRAPDPFGGHAGELPGPSLSSGDLDQRAAPIASIAGNGQQNRERRRVSDLESWRVMRENGRVIGPMDLEELKARIESGDVGMGDRLSRNEDPFRPSSGYPQVVGLLGRALTRSAPVPVGRSSTMWIGLAAVLLAAAGGAAFLLGRPSATRPASPTADAYQRRIAVWALAVPDSPDTAEAAYEKGRKLLAQDTDASLAAAMNEFRKAVVKKPESWKAAAGFVEAFAIRSREITDEEAVREARDVIAHAITEAPEDPAVQRAYAHLLLSSDETGDQVMEARSHAQKAKELSGGDAESLMALGRTYIRHNADIALEHLDQALAKDPQLKRAYVYRGLAREKVGRYAAAVADFRKRLEIDPDDRTALEDTARVAATVGDFAQVRAIYEGVLRKAPDDPGARLALAILAYQVDREIPRAQRAIDALVEIQEQLTDELRGRVLGHAAALARERGDLERASQLVGFAQSLGPHAGPALFQGVLVALGKGDVEGARQLLPRFRDRMSDDVAAFLLVGRINAAAGQDREALDAFSQAEQLGAQRVEPPLFVASLQTRLKGVQQALGALRKAAEIDPAPDHPRLTDYHESRASLLHGLERPFLDVASEELDRAIAWSGAGMVLWHRGERAAALQLFQKTLAVDSLALPALVYTAQGRYEQGDMQGALAAARGAIQSEKFSPIGHFLEGRILEGRAPPEEIARAYEKALEVGPTYAPALERVAALDLKAGRKDDAERRFREVVTADRTNLAARLALYHMGY